MERIALPVGRLDAVLSAEDLKRAGNIVAPAKRTAFLKAKLALRCILASRIGVPPDVIPISRRCTHCGDPTHGKPRVEGPFGTNTRFNVSHSASLLAIAVTGTSEPGIDVEQVRRLDRWQRLRRVAFTEQESEMLEDAGSHESELAARLWCRKEAVAKALGYGLALPIAQVTVTEVSSDGRGNAKLPAPHDSQSVVFMDIPWHQQPEVVVAAAVVAPASSVERVVRRSERDLVAAVEEWL